MNYHNKYLLIGIGDFSHGDRNIWEYRLRVMKNIILETNKKILLFLEDNNYHIKNITNINKRLSYRKSYGVFKENYPYGPLEKYSHRVYDSPIYLNFIKYVRKHKKRIKIIGTDNNKIARDEYMYNKIIKNINYNKINLFFAHNAHIDNRKITEPFETKYHNEKYRCGYYLKKKFKQKYCIILSTGYKGKIRFDCKCDDKYCSNRDFYTIPKKVMIENNISNYYKYKSGIYNNNKFNNILCEYTACIFPHNNVRYIKSKNCDFVLFFKNLKPLKLIKI
jgi:hypothetical protein